MVAKNSSTRTHENDVRGLHQVGPRGSALQRQHDHFDVFVLLEVFNGLCFLPDISTKNFEFI